jgi:hypothetical protein
MLYPLQLLIHNLCSSYSIVKIPHKLMVSAIRHKQLSLKTNSLVQMVMYDIIKDPNM